MPSDDLDRDRLYSTDANDEDDAELELEPLDPDVVAAEQRRAEDTVAEAERSIDVDEIYRDFEGRRDEEILNEWLNKLSLRRVQFQVKHLLILTAVVAIVLTLIQWSSFVAVLVVAVMIGVAGITLYLQWQEKLRQDEADRRRQQMYAARRAHLPKYGKPRPAMEPDPSAGAPRPNAATTLADDFDNARKAAASQFHFKFSLAQLLIVLTTAAVLLGLIRIFGGPGQLAVMCGMLALAGLVVNALGYEPHRMVVFGWWIMLVLYVVLGISGTVWNAIATP